MLVNSTFLEGKPKLKTKERLETGGHTCQWFAYAQLTERFKLGKKYDFINE